MLATIAHKRHAELLGKDPAGHRLDEETREAARRSLKAARLASAMALEITRALAAAEPTIAAHKRDLAGAFRHVGELAAEQEDLNAAARAFSRARKLFEALASADPTNAAIKRTLVDLFEKIAAVSAARADLGAEQRALGRVIRLSRSLAASYPENAAQQFVLAQAYFNRGNISMARKDKDKARKDFLKAVDVLTPVVAADRTAANRSGELHAVLLSSIHRMLGQIAETSHQKQAAHKGLLDSHKVLESLVSAAPTNSNYIGNLSNSSDTLGKMAMARGDLKTAKEAFLRSYQLTASLVAADTTCSTYNRMLLNSNVQLIRLALKQEDTATLRKHLRQARDLVKALDTMGLVPQPPLKRQRQEVLRLAKKHLP